MNTADIPDDPALPAPNLELVAAALEVDADGVRVREVVQLFLARLIDPTLLQSAAQLTGVAGEEVDDVTPHSFAGQDEGNNNANSRGAAVEAEHEMTYLVRQLERISTTTDWSTCVVRWSHLVRFDADVALVIESDFQRFSPFLDDALHRTLLQYYAEDYTNRGRCHPSLVFADVPRCLTIRALRASMVGQLCAIKGVVTRTSQVRPELLVGVFRCADCGTESMPVAQPFHYTEPPSCRNPQCENKTRFQLIPSHPQTRFGDWQKLRMQEDANNIPAGCMPRTMEVIVRSDAVEVAKPGDRVIAVGCAIVVPEVAKLFNQANRREVQRQMSGAQRAMQDAQADTEGATGLRALGVRELNYRMCFLATTLTDPSGDDRKMTAAVKEATMDPAEREDGPALTPAEWQKVQQMRRHDGLLRALTRCVAPNIFKHDVVKLGLLLQMVGGVSKTTIEHIALRGDINVCIVGDPSTAKSQFLKWVANAMPRGVYTSGKASTASGLTATVTRDADTGERTIEAGALMLSDRGICCIDEFDKMELKDQVAIHEAMEQQTISIAKAGIRATLNAKTSLLAALNPIGGKYDRRKPLQKNIAMPAPILSRFDLMFVIVDDAGDDADYTVADQLLRLHRFGGAAVRQPFSNEDFQLYLRYTRALTPRLTPAASQLIVAAYRDMRLQDSLSNRSKVYRVTTRLLESMIRLSEATAKLFLSEDVLASHVEVALELMRQSLSTLDMTEVELVGGEGGGDAADDETANNNNNNNVIRSAVTHNDTKAGRVDAVQSSGQDIRVKREPAHQPATSDDVSRRRRGDSVGSEASTSYATSVNSGASRARRGRAAGGKRARHTAATSTAAAATTPSVPPSQVAGVEENEGRPMVTSAAPRKVVITADHYFSIVNRLVSHLVALGEDGAPTRQELVTWYLEQVQSLNRAQLELELRYVNLVLNKMMKEGKLLHVELREGEAKRVFLDPNYNPDIS